MNSRTKAVDTKKHRSYKAPVFATLVLLMAGSAFAATTTGNGAVLPSGSRQVGEDRYRSPSNYADTLAFYGKQYKSNPRKTIVNQPGIRAVHIVNDGKGDWDGLNVYEFEGETRIYVVRRDVPKARK